jgi:hypothetical protein
LEASNNGDRNYENDDADDDDDDGDGGGGGGGGGGGDKDNCCLGGTFFKFRETDKNHTMLIQVHLDFVLTNCFPEFDLNVILSSLSQSSK